MHFVRPAILGVALGASALYANVEIIDEQAGIALNVSAGGEGQALSLNITSSDPLPFDESIGVNGSGDPVNAQSSAALYTYSRSTAGGLALSADGAFDVSAAQNDANDPAASSYSIGYSGFSVRFSLDRPASYSAIGSVFKANATALGEDESLAYARLEHVDAEAGTPQLLWQVTATGGNSASIDRADILDGNEQYILTVQSLGWVQATSSATPRSNAGSHQIDFNLSDFAAGDADLDGDVDLSDLGALASHYGAMSGGTWSWGDFDYDGDVDLADLGSLASNYGSGQAQFASDWATLSTSVPEPFPAASGLLSLAPLLRRRRRRRELALTTPADSSPPCP